MGFGCRASAFPGCVLGGVIVPCAEPGTTSGSYSAFFEADLTYDSPNAKFINLRQISRGLQKPQKMLHHYYPQAD